MNSELKRSSKTSVYDCDKLIGSYFKLGNGTYYKVDNVSLYKTKNGVISEIHRVIHLIKLITIEEICCEDIKLPNEKTLIIDINTRKVYTNNTSVAICKLEDYNIKYDIEEVKLNLLQLILDKMTKLRIATKIISKL